LGAFNSGHESEYKTKSKKQKNELTGFCVLFLLLWLSIRKKKTKQILIVLFSLIKNVVVIILQYFEKPASIKCSLYMWGFKKTIGK
jgi:uncharacterized membrane protein